MNGLTWYDILDVLPGASTDEIEQAYQVRAALLGPDALWGASPEVLTAAVRGRAFIEKAWRVLGDPERRRRYDLQAGLRVVGAGLERTEPEPSEPSYDPVLPGHPQVWVAEAAFLMLADVLGPHDPGPSRRVVVPDVRGLFVGACYEAVGDALRMETILLTEHPVAAEGLVVDQSPAPGTKVRRASTLTVRVWHPPRHQVSTG